MGYQPRIDDPVWFGGTQVNDTDFGTTGLGVLIDKIIGWEGAEEIRDSRIPNGGFDGEYAADSYRGGRTITVQGRVFGSSWENLQSRKRTLNATFEQSATEALFKVPDPNEVPWETGIEDQTPVFWLRLDSDGTDSSGNSYDFTVTGTLTSTTGLLTASADPDADQALTGWSGSNYAERAYAAALNPASFTIVALVSLDAATGTNYTIYDCRNGTSQGFMLRVNTSGYVEMVNCDGSATTVSYTQDITDGATYFVAATYDGTTVTVYVNDNSNSGADTITANASVASRVGAQLDAANPWPSDGAIDELTLYSKVLTAAELDDLYNRSIYDATTYAAEDMYSYERINARVVEAIEYAPAFSIGAQAFQVILRASDPAIRTDWYTADTTTSVANGTMSLATSNDGQSPADWVAKIDTPVYFTNGGVRMIVNGEQAASVLKDSSLASGEELEIDSSTRKITLTRDYDSVRLYDLDAIAYYKLDETSGTTADNAEGTAGYDGTYVDSPTLNQSGIFANSKAVDFSANDYVQIPLNAALYPSEWSWEGWVLQDTYGAEDVLITSNNSAKLSIVYGSLYLYAGDTSGGSDHQSAYGGRITVNTWHHIGFAKTADNRFTAFLDGKAVAFVDQPLNDWDSGGAYTWRLGNSSGSNNLNGKLDNLALLPRALSEAEMTECYEASAETGNTITVIAEQYLDAGNCKWTRLPTGASTNTILAYNASDGTTTFTFKYRDQRY